MCLICCEESKENVSCPYCQFESCRKCAERYLTETTQTAHCMSCRKGWGTNLIFDLFDKQFYEKKYKPHLVNMLIQEEKSHFPELQEAAKEYKKIKQERKRLRLEREKLEKELAKERGEIDKLYDHYVEFLAPLFRKIWLLFPKLTREKLHFSKRTILYKSFKKLFTKAEQEEYWTNPEFRNLAQQVESLLAEYRLHHENLPCHNTSKGLRITKFELTQLDTAQRNILMSKKKTETKTTYTYPCSVEECSGFLDEKWICGLCEEKTCSRCFRVKKPQHTCKEDDVESVKLLKKETKPCPKCATFIFKTSGCDQMFCTNCHVAFSWKTLQIETGAVHNPHYFEWLANNAVGFELPVGNNQCQEEFRIYNIPSSKRQGDEYRFVCKIYERAREVGNNWFKMRRNIQPVTPENLRENNILFLAGEKSEANWKKMLSKYRKQMDKEREINSIYQMFRTAVMDLFRYYYSLDRTEEFDIRKSVEQVIDMMNNNLKRVANLYSTVAVRILDNRYEWVRIE